MLDIKLMRQDPAFFKKALQKKGNFSKIIDELLKIDEKNRKMNQRRDEFKNKQNKISKKIALLKDSEEKQKILKEMKKSSNELKEISKEINKFNDIFMQMFSNLPNICHESVPKGKNDSENVEIERVGNIPQFDFKPKEHFTLAEKLGILDMKRAAKISGSRFYFLRNELAILQMALMNWAFLEIEKKGFSPTIPPFMTRKEAIFGTGYLEKDENYIINPGNDDLYLIGTSEVPLTSFHANEILDEKNLPVKFAGYSPCFRREAGSYGKDIKGILRVHQFEKIEMVVVCKKEDSWKIHEEMKEIEKDLLQKLKIPFRVMNICGGDLGGSAAKKYDLEAWLPGQNKFREMTSTSNCTDYQARRLNIKIRRKNGETELAHTLNGTAVSSRPLIAILENFQQKDGSVKIPQVLWPFTGGLKEIKSR